MASWPTGVYEVVTHLTVVLLYCDMGIMNDCLIRFYRYSKRKNCTVHLNVFENLDYFLANFLNLKEVLTWSSGVYEAITWNTSTKIPLNCDMDNEKEGKTVLLVVLLCLHTGYCLADLRPSEVQHCGPMTLLLGAYGPRPVYTVTWTQKKEDGQYYNTTSISGVYAAVTWNTTSLSGVYAAVTWNISTKARVYCNMDTEKGG